MLPITLFLLAQLDAGHWTERCALVADRLLPDSGRMVINCSVPVYAARFASTSSPHRDSLHFKANAPVPLFATIDSENGDWDFADTSGVTEVHGFVEAGAGNVGRAGVELYCNNLDGGYVDNINPCAAIGNGPTSAKINWWDKKGSFVSAGGDMTYVGDDNEKHIYAATSRGPNYAARLQLSGSDPTGGPQVYVQKRAGSPGDPFQVIADGVPAGFTTNSGVRAGKVAQLPSCSANNEGVLLYFAPSRCFVGCDGETWACLQRTPP